jgi:[acyl-carrier-protein] S-malonyltransferase
MNAIGFLFPGQGAQAVGMGRDLYDHFPAAKAIFDRADELLGYSISRICFEGPEDQLTRTLYAQPAIYVMSLAAWAVLKEKFPGLKPVFSAGLSLGEWTALAAAEALSWEDGLKLVQIRAQAMESAAQKNPGTMASALGLSLELCREAAEEAGCEVANLNSPDQTVFSGTVESITRVIPIAEAKGAKKVIPLKVGGAFHSRLMSDARETLATALGAVALKAPACTFIPNTTAQTESNPEQIKNLLALQVTSSVRWVETMQAAEKSGAKLFLEIGPGKVLKGLARKCSLTAPVEPCGTKEDLEKLETLLRAIVS